jgi:hypothetical protein
MIRRVALLVVGLAIGVGGPAPAQETTPSGCEAVPASVNCKLLDDFESDTPGQPPRNWRTDKNRDTLVPITDEVLSDRQHVFVREEEGNQFARVYTRNEAYRVIRSHKYSLDWHVEKRPYLRWRWRAKALPEGANEKEGRNDTGGALYVTFDTDWLGRPKSIKYTYSSSLPVGTTVDFGPLQVLVVASKPDNGLDKWITHERNVVEDYRRLFGEAPDKTPLAIMMWSDSDTMKSVGTVDFDDLMLLSKPSHSADSATASTQ